MSGKTEVEPRAAGSVTSSRDRQTAPDPVAVNTRRACCAVSGPDVHAVDHHSRDVAHHHRGRSASAQVVPPEDRDLDRAGGLGEERPAEVKVTAAEQGKTVRVRLSAARTRDAAGASSAGTKSAATYPFER
jgi:hypothetical protein